MKWYGEICFAYTQEVKPAIWEPYEVIHNYCGDVKQLPKSANKAREEINGDIDVTMTLSIIADDLLYDHFTCIKYVTMYGHKWTVKSVEPSYPRMTLNIGGVYNG